MGEELQRTDEEDARESTEAVNWWLLTPKRKAEPAGASPVAGPWWWTRRPKAEYASRASARMEKETRWLEGAERSAERRSSREAKNDGS